MLIIHFDFSLITIKTREIILCSGCHQCLICWYAGLHTVRGWVAFTGNNQLSENISCFSFKFILQKYIMSKQIYLIWYFMLISLSFYRCQTHIRVTAVIYCIREYVLLTCISIIYGEYITILIFRKLICYKSIKVGQDP